MTDSLNAFLDEQFTAFDLTSILSRSIDDMESEFAGETVYKYYSKARRGFFAKPQVRFTQKIGLNDPFELTKRWKEFGSPPTREVFINYLRSSMKGLFSRKDIILDMLIADAIKEGRSLSAEQVAFATAALNGPEGQAFLAQQSIAADAMIAPFIEAIFSAWATDSDKMIEGIVSDMGIFAVSETATNHQLWGLYADSGMGFSVELKAQHPFFRNILQDGKDVNLLRKVTYTDLRIPDFWQNPYYLFLVKGKNWSFEREWRMVKKLSECSRLPIPDVGGIYVRDLPVGSIKSVIFGYQYDQNSLAEDAKQINAFDPAICLQSAVVNEQTGDLEIRPL